MKNFLIVILFSSCITQAQSTDLIAHYQLEFKRFTESDKVGTEDLVLIAKKDAKSYFMYEKMIVIDSIHKERELNIADIMLLKSPLYYLIEREGNAVIHYESFGNDLLKFKESVELNWKLLNEEKMIRGFKCKKATVNYEGRNWVAWYATDIPVSSGPYKFHGLPGLILDISDINNQFHFSIDKLIPGSFDVNPKVTNFFVFEGNASFQDVSKYDFHKFRRKYHAMSLNERIQYLNRDKEGAYSIKATEVNGAEINTNRKPKTKNFIEKYD
jgi:GLPGLI family protein